MIHNRQRSDEKTKSPDCISPDRRELRCSGQAVEKDARPESTCWDSRAPGERVVESGWMQLPPARHRRVVKVEEMNTGFLVLLLPHLGKTGPVMCRPQEHSREGGAAQSCW